MENSKDTERPAQSESLFNSTEYIDRAELLMTGFATWLNDNGYGEYVDRYSDLDDVHRRLRLVDVAHYVVNDRGEITAFPINNFEDVTGASYPESTDTEKESYASRERKLSYALGELATISALAAADEASGESSEGTLKMFRRDTADAINSYALHYDGQKDVVSAMYFARYSEHTFATKKSDDWLGRLLIARDSTEHDLHDTISTRERLFKVGKTTLSDVYFRDLLNGKYGNEREM